MKKLKSCPFCGEQEDVFLNTNNCVQFYECNNCGASGSVVDVEIDDPFPAIRAWNRRI